MPYIGVSHGSDTNYIFNGLFPEGEVTEDDQTLSKNFSESFINFAYTGMPTDGSNGAGVPHAWPVAFTELEQAEPVQLNLETVGGPLGTGAASVEQMLAADFLANFGSQGNERQQIFLVVSR